MARRGARFGRGERIQIITKKRIAAKICTRCGRNKPDEWRKMCRVCLDKRIESRKKTAVKQSTSSGGKDEK